MTPEDRQVYGGLMHSWAMEMVLTDLVTYVNQQIALESIEVQNAASPPSDIGQKFVVSRIGIDGDVQGEIAFATTLNLAIAYSSCMLGLSQTGTKKYLEEENYDADMQDATTEIFNLTTGALEKALRKHLDMSLNCKQLETVLVDFSSESGPDLLQGSCDWIVQKASIAEMEVEGAYFQVLPEEMANAFTEAIAQNLAIEDARKQFEEKASLKVGETQAQKKAGQEVKRILVIEDTHLIRRLMVEHLKEARYVVFEKDDGLGGVRWASMMGKKINLIILDLKLPSMSGYRVIEILNAQEHTKDIPVMICSSVTDRNALMRLRKLGIKDFVVKPFTREVLLSKVINIIGRPN